MSKSTMMRTPGQQSEAGFSPQHQLQKVGKALYTTSLYGLETTGLDVNSITSYTNKFSNLLGNTFTGPTAFVVGVCVLSGLWASLVVSSIFLFFFWPLLLGAAVVTIFNFGVARVFTSWTDVKTRAYPRLIAALTAQVVLGVPMYLFGPMLVVVGALTGLLVSGCVFLALSIALFLAVVSTANNAYAVHMASLDSTSGSASTPSSAAAPSNAPSSSFAPPFYTLGERPGSNGNGNGAGAEVASEGHDAQAIATPSLYQLISSGPLQLFINYPILIVGLLVTPVICSILFLLLVTSPYWFIWWYVSTPMFLTGAIGLEVGFVFLFWSRMFSQHVYGRVSRGASRVYNFSTTAIRNIYRKLKEVAIQIRKDFNARKEHYEQQRLQKQQRQVHTAQPPRHYAKPIISPPQPRPATPTTDEDAHGSSSSAISSLSSSRRSSHSGEGVREDTTPPVAPSVDNVAESEEKSAPKSKKNNNKRNNHP